MLPLILGVKSAEGQFYTGSDHEFGQNRVQYNPLYWQFYNFERFKVFFVSSGRDHAEYVAKAAHKYLKQVEQFLDYPVQTKLQFVVFNTQASFKQSNIGLRNNSTSNIGGMTTIDGNKIFLYYEGDHQSLDEQVKAGIANMVVHRMMYGENWKEALKSSALMTFPDWFLKGFVSYMEGDWNSEIDDKVREGVLSGRFNKFNRLEGEDAEVAGRALWNYIAEAYGEKMIPNVLYMTKVSRNVESGFLYVLGTSLKRLSSDFVQYYKQRYTIDVSGRTATTADELHIKTKKTRTYSQFKLSPDKKYAAYVSNELGQYKVWLYDIKKQEAKAVSRFEKYSEKKEAFDQAQNEKSMADPSYKMKMYKSYRPKYYRSKKIHKGDHKLDHIPDVSFPVLAWHPSGEMLAFVEEKKGEVVLNKYELETGKLNSNPLLNLEKVLSMSYGNKGKKIVMSAVAKGRTDIYVYNIIGNNQKKITDDPYDDLNPQFLDNETKVIFSSNRENDTIKRKEGIELRRYEKDIFIVDLDKIGYPMQRITRTPHIDEDFPGQYDAKHYSFISDKNGIYNFYQAYYDSAVSFIDTAVHYRYFSVKTCMSDFDRNVSEYSTIPGSNFYGYMSKRDGRYRFYKGDKRKDNIIEDELVNTKFMQYKLKSLSEEGLIEIPIETEEVPLDSGFVNIDNYDFGESTSSVKKEVIVIKEEQEIHPDSIKLEPIVDESFKLPREEIYNVNYTTDYIVSQIDNSFLNQTYQRYTGGSYQNPGFNALALLGMIDLMEDYRIIGGFRFPVNLSNSEYLLSYENLKDRVDKKILGSRQSFNQGIGTSKLEKVQTYELKHSWKYPFSEVASLRFTLNARHDRRITLSQNDPSLEEPNQFYYLGGSKLEYVYDNTRSLGINIMNGMRMKFWGEITRELDMRQTNFVVLGMDIRHYLKVHRSITFASRFAASTSLGQQRLVYYLGGVDNWLGASFDQSIQVDPTQNYQFQTIATPMRGFYQNTRNGNSFAVLNNELRVPLFKYLSAKPLKSDFLDNFMVIGFGDVGTAWTGANPYTNENSFNSTLVQGPNYLVTLQNQREPIVYGYGVGLRSRLFSYYVRFDWAWGVDDGVILPSVKYLSLSLDF